VWQCHVSPGSFTCAVLADTQVHGLFPNPKAEHFPVIYVLGCDRPGDRTLNLPPQKRMLYHWATRVRSVIYCVLITTYRNSRFNINGCETFYHHLPFHLSKSSWQGIILNSFCIVNLLNCISSKILCWDSAKFFRCPLLDALLWLACLDIRSIYNRDTVSIWSDMHI
jgi:hypothetical protein